MKPRKNGESDADYIKRLEAANDGLRQENAGLKDWGTRLNDATTTLSTEGSLVFQAMAEKAGVRSHPSVTEAVRLFDYISHPQWRQNGERPTVNWPDDWNFDAPGDQSGDADMTLNSPIADAIEYIDASTRYVPRKMLEAGQRIAEKLQLALRGRVEWFKDSAGFRPIHIAPRVQAHYRDASTDELREIVSAMGWMALDLAQDMAFANEMLRRDLRASTYRRVCADLYRLSQYGFDQPPGKFDIKILGGLQETF